MRSGPNTRRLRGRNSGRRNQSSRPQNFESSGPETKVRGNAQQVVEKYLQLARDASTAGNRVIAENFYQHAEHYHRIQEASAAASENRPDRPDRQPEGSQEALPNGASNGSPNGNGTDARDGDGSNARANGSGEQPASDGDKVSEAPDSQPETENPAQEAG